MKNFAVAIIVLLAVGFVGWSATSVGIERQVASVRAAVAAAPSDSASGALATSDRSGESSSQPAAVPASKPAGLKAVSTRPGEGVSAENAMAAMRLAADAKKHLFVFVQGAKQDEQTLAARKIYGAALSKLGDKVQSFTVNRDAMSERMFVEQFALQSAPLPIVLVLAPNGAITGGFLGSQLNEQRLMESLAGPAKQECLKALQDRKLVLLCVQNSKTKSNDIAMKGVNAFKSDARYAEFTEVVMLDPACDDEKLFLNQLELAEKMGEATTILLAPPGSLVAKFTGATEKDVLVKALQKASSGCGPGGCSRSGCGPKKK